MLFNSLEFFGFFAVVLAVYGLLRAHWRARKMMLLLASYVFYMTWNPPFVLLLIGSTLLDFVAGRRLAASNVPRVRRAWLAVSCAGNLGVLAFFKYGAFLAENLQAVLPFLGSPPAWLTQIVLPVGISFYTFQSLSYTIDVYRRQQEPTRDLLDFALYVAFFPQLVAGPIIRSTHFLPQLTTNRRFDAEQVLRGTDLVFRGLAKKVLLADTLGSYVDLVYATPGEFGALNHLIAVYCYAFQIYCDFSGYSDIAIGTAAIMGFRVPINFRLPYLSRNPFEFWTRWHISLSTWLRDYLFISLGGSRGSRARIFGNLMVTMLLGGLWHGAAWHFVLWGAFHGVWLAVYGAWFRDRRDHRLPHALRVIVAFHLVCVGWVLFRAQSLADIPVIFRGFLDFSRPVALVEPAVLLALAVAMVAHVLGASGRLARDWMDAVFVTRALAWAAVIVAIFFSEKTVRFIYFQF